MGLLRGVAVAAVGAALLALLPDAGRATAPVGRDLPDGAPPALYRDEPGLPAPRDWPFPDAFPRTSGFGRTAGGAAYWSDFIYDDYGAIGVFARSYVVGLSPTEGTYAYPDGPAAENGADIFRAAVGAGADATWWRVDWQTLNDPAVPIAMWALDTDASAATGAAEWPAQAGVMSPGIERWLVMSSRGAWLLDSDGNAVAVPSAVDTESRSFVARVPHSVLPVSATWRVRLVSGVADAEGDGFLPLDTDLGALPTQPAVFNVAFRSHEQEAAEGDNWWREDAQASALTSGDVSDFSLTVDWSDLAARKETSEPQPSGFSNRWFVSSYEDGQGVVRNPPQWSSDMRANYVNRVQPYGIYVPSDLDPRTPVPLTLVLHSLNVNHNQYGMFNPAFLEAACEGRRSICVTPFARGPDSWYFGEGELDVWEVWNRVASAFTLDPARTTVSGYSMGGFGTYRFGFEHPDLFAQAVVLAGPPNCSLRIVKGAEVPANLGLRECEAEADQSVLVENGRELPFYIGQGAFDELVFSPSVVEQAGRFDALGYRHRFELYANQTHTPWAMTGAFEGAAAWLADRTVPPDPACITYRWYASHQRPDLGVGPDRVWWISGLKARQSTPGFTARVDAVSSALSSSTPTIERSADAVANADGTAAVRELTWAGGEVTRPSENRIEVDLDGVAAATFDLARAGFRAGDAGIVVVDSDGPAEIVLSLAERRLAVSVPGGRTEIPVLKLPPAPAPASAARGDRLPATGGATDVGLGLILATLAFGLRSLTGTAGGVPSSNGHETPLSRHHRRRIARRCRLRERRHRHHRGNETPKAAR